MNLMFDGYGRALERAGFERVERASGGDELTWGIAADPLLDQVATIVEEGRRAGRPQLVTAWTTECHRPYDFQARTDGEAPAATPGAAASPRDHYRACAASLAASLGRFVERLRASGAGGDTMVVAFGDHGQTFGEDHPGALAFGQHVYEPSLHVPLLLFLPPGAAAADVAGARDARLFQIVDVPRTIAAALGLAIPPAWVGRDMLDPDEPGREHAFVVSILDSDVLGAIDRSGQKEVRARDDRLVAYDLAKDPAELAPEPLDGDRAEAARRRLHTYLAVADRRMGGSRAERGWTGDLSRRGSARLRTCRPVHRGSPRSGGGGILVEPRAQPECASGGGPAKPADHPPSRRAHRDASPLDPPASRERASARRGSPRQGAPRSTERMERARARAHRRTLAGRRARAPRAARQGPGASASEVAAERGSS
jgi:hypothetical protein